jgi:predicted thioesterase
MVLPVSEWTLSRAQNGNLISALKDNRTGRLSAFSASVFQRGYQANFQLNPKIYHQSSLSKGDTIASMYSNQDLEQLVELQGELAVQKAELQLDSSGKKTADVEEVTSQAAVAQQELAAQRLLTERTKALYQDSLTSLQEYELAVNKLRIRELNVKLLDATYKSATTGSKPEQLQVVRTRINSLQRQIQHIKNGLRDLTLVAPVSGTVLLEKAAVNPTEEVLVAVADNSAYVLLLPVSYLEKDYVQLHQKVEISITGTTQTAIGKIIGIDNTVQIVDGRQAFFVTALVEEKDAPLVPGMLVRTAVACQPLALKDHLARSIGSLFIY